MSVSNDYKINIQKIVAKLDPIDDKKFTSIIGIKVFGKKYINQTLLRHLIAEANVILELYVESKIYTLDTPLQTEFGFDIFYQEELDLFFYSSVLKIEPPIPILKQIVDINYDNRIIMFQHKTPMSSKKTSILLISCLTGRNKMHATIKI